MKKIIFSALFLSFALTAPAGATVPYPESLQQDGWEKTNKDILDDVKKKLDCVESQQEKNAEFLQQIKNEIKELS